MLPLGVITHMALGGEGFGTDVAGVGFTISSISASHLKIRKKHVCKFYYIASELAGHIISLLLHLIFKNP